MLKMLTSRAEMLKCVGKVVWIIGKGEVRMSVEKLEFDWREYDCNVKIDCVLAIEGKRQDTIRFMIEQHNTLSAFELDRSQAHLLMLYLQEHLNG